MKKTICKTSFRKRPICILAAVLAADVLFLSPAGSLKAGAAPSIQEVKDKINETQHELDQINDNIDTLTEEQELLEEQMDDLNSEIINMLTSIGMLEDDIRDKEADIAETQKQYDAAKQQEEDHQEAMVCRIQMMYEKGQTSSIEMLLTSTSLAELLNRMAYAKEVQDYEQKLLDQYNELKNQVHDLWDRLEEEKTQLEVHKTSLEEQKVYCDGLIEELRKQSDQYDAQIAKAKKDAEKAKAELQKEKKELKKLEEAERKRREEEKRRKAAEEAARKAAQAGGGAVQKTDTATIITNATGSALGKEIASYACKFVGNPYVAGGTSLTNGADCSGFTYRVYQDYGYTIPRSSYEQRSAGTGVEYSNAQPGDLICYAGHVAMYIGDGKIVHASSQKTGIKIGNANYKPILAVRRIVN